VSDLDPIAAQMRAVRLRRNWSLPQAALRVGLEPIVVGSYERGDRQPGLRRLRQWVEGMGLRLLLVGGPGDTAVDGEQVWEEHAVNWDGPELILCDSAEEAAAVARRMSGAVPVRRVVRSGGWRVRPGADDA
jgi:transcriptional regulator with XRE-family HTH domain